MTIQGRGTPDTPENIYKDRITYNHELTKWICNICGKQYAPQSQQNAIQHACNHYQQNKRERAPEIKWAPGTQEEEIYTLRKNTLVNYNTPSGKTEEKENKKTNNLQQRKQEKGNISRKHKTHRKNCRRMEMHRTDMPNKKKKTTPLIRHIAKQHPEKHINSKNRYKMPMVWGNIQRHKLNTETPKNTNTTHMAHRNMPHKTRK